MSVVMEEEIKRRTARRKSALVLEIIQGRTTASEASRQFDLTPPEIESSVKDGKRGMENALRAKPENVRDQYERQLEDLQEAYGEAMLELRAKKYSPWWARTRPDGRDPAGTAGRGVRGFDGEAVPLVWRGASHGVLPVDEVAGAY
jgi:hypothetical protein